MVDTNKTNQKIDVLRNEIEELKIKLKNAQDVSEELLKRIKQKNQENYDLGEKLKSLLKTKK